jgi:haloacetate dehalogenase
LPAPRFATRYFWWFFQIQAAPLPERFIGALPDYYVESHLAIQSKTPGAVTPEALAAHVRTYSEPAAIHAVCEDYRAAAGIDSRLLAASRTADDGVGSSTSVRTPDPGEGLSR